MVGANGSILYTIGMSIGYLPGKGIVYASCTTGMRRYIGKERWLIMKKVHHEEKEESTALQPTLYEYEPLKMALGYLGRSF